MSDQISEPPELTSLLKLDWKLATSEGNKLCNNIQKMMKNVKETDEFQTDIILALNEFLNTIFDIINNKVPGLGEFLELKGLENIHRPDWGKAFLPSENLRQPIRPPDNLKNQLTDMETKIQLILARIPKTEDFVKEIKTEFQNGTMNTPDEFKRVQDGLRHVTFRMDEIEEFRTLWKLHKDALTSLLKKKNVPFNARPNDIAGIRLYQFINTPLGTPCYQIITLNGWPTTEEWKSWEAWWNIQMQRIADHEEHIGVKALSSATWPMQVAHTSAMIMQAIMEINTAAAENIAQIQLEPLLWKIAFIQNALTEIFIIPKSNEKSWFANLWSVNEKILKKKPNIQQLQKILATLVPAKIPEDHILHVSTPVKDLIPINEHKLVVATTKVPVPRIRSLPMNYRIQLEDEENKENIPPEEIEKPSSSGKRSRKVLQAQRKQPTLKKEKVKKRKISSSESSAEESQMSSEDDLEKNKVVIGSSSSEDEDFNVYNM